MSRRRVTDREILPRRLRGLGLRRVEPDRSREPIAARIIHLSTGIPLRDGAEWVTALCSGTANPHPEDLARASYVIEIETPEPVAEEVVTAWGGTQLVALIEPDRVNEFGWINLANYLRSKGHEGYHLARLIVPFRDRVLAEYEDKRGHRPPRRPVYAGGRLVEDVAFSEATDRALIDHVYETHAAALMGDLAA